MTVPQKLGFEVRLETAAALAFARGELSRQDYDSLLADPDFDDDRFEAFRVRLQRAGLALPEEDPEDAMARRVDRRLAPGEPERDLLDLYLDEIGRIPLLAHDEQLATAARARGGDERARKAMILANLRLVVHVARAYQHRGLPMLDLIEEGNLGLIHAVDRFDPLRGHRFSTYASLWIRQSIVRGLAEQSRSVRIPVEMFRQMNRYVRVNRTLVGVLGREPRPEEIAPELGISLDRAERLHRLVAGMRSLDEHDGVDAFEELSAEAIGRQPESLERMVELQMEHERLDRLVRTLSQREEQIIRIRYGFHDGEARTLQETGEHFGITRERVRQIEARALEKLRRAIELVEAEGSRAEIVH